MTLPRLEVLFRVGPASDTLTARYDVGGASDSGDQTVTLDHGLYTFTALLAHLSSKVGVAVGGAIDFQWLSGRVFVEADNSSQVTWDHLALRDWLGFAGDLALATEWTAPAAPPGVFYASMPWDDPAELGFVFQTRRWSPPGRTGGGATLLGSHRSWQTVVHVAGATDVAQLRSVLRLLLRGRPARWWRNTADNTAWATGNWDGYLDVVLDQGSRSLAEAFVSDVVQHQMTVPLAFVEWSP